MTPQQWSGLSGDSPAEWDSVCRSWGVQPAASSPVLWVQRGEQAQSHPAEKALAEQKGAGQPTIPRHYWPRAQGLPGAGRPEPCI